MTKQKSIFLCDRENIFLLSQLMHLSSLRQTPFKANRNIWNCRIILIPFSETDLTFSLFSLFIFKVQIMLWWSLAYKSRSFTHISWLHPSWIWIIEKYLKTFSGKNFFSLRWAHHVAAGSQSILFVSLHSRQSKIIPRQRHQMGEMFLEESFA